VKSYKNFPVNLHFTVCGAEGVGGGKLRHVPLGGVSQG